LKVEVQGVTGSIEAAELSNEKIGRPDEYFAAGDNVEAIVTEVSRDTWSLKLSIRRVLERAERASFEQYLDDEPTNSKVTLGDLFEDQFAGKKNRKK
jgi:small subunit ribosomal protein S1